jgi:hypothetical protein
MIRAAFLLILLILTSATAASGMSSSSTTALRPDAGLASGRSPHRQGVQSASGGSVVRRRNPKPYIESVT